MKPPTGGPTTGPTSAGIVTHAMALTRSRFSMVRTSTSRPTGVIIAPPMPCTMRATTKPSSELASAQPTEPSMNTKIAAREHAAGAEAVGGPAARRDEYCEREQVGGDGEFQRQRTCADVGRDRRQRGRDHGRIEILHEQGARHDQRHEAGCDAWKLGQRGGRAVLAFQSQRGCAASCGGVCHSYMEWPKAAEFRLRA